MAFVKPTFHLRISNPERVFYDGQAYSLSSTNKSGPFDILPDHAQFISLLDNTNVTVHQEGDQTQTYTINRGLISAKENEVKVFVDL